MKTITTTPGAHDALEARARLISRSFHVRELYRVIAIARDSIREGDVEQALALLEAIDEQPPAEPADLSAEEFKQAFEAFA